jgi:RimJ/RimL family protein N-acetyltransferase
MEASTWLADGPVQIRPFQAGDIDEVYAAVRESVAEVGLWMPDLANPSREDIAAWIATRPAAWSNGMAYSFAIVDGQDGHFLGGTGLSFIHSVHRFANLFYWVRSSHLRRGVATAAALLTARFGFDTLALNRVEIVVAVDNYPASAWPKKLALCAKACCATASCSMARSTTR